MKWIFLQILISSFVESSHIRLLAFSPVGIADCSVKIDESFEKQCEQVTENLFVVEWNPKLYKDGVHHVIVTVADKLNRQKRVKTGLSFYLIESNPLKLPSF